ncbi:hypothetical protein EB796_015004 [Bugula neritina]|uniref:Uncharacterized protein n=1 Tax=Bugula neritina TaxID=10212 RepID=A0A7J7JM51_BUGNE|nr:hypothetical protein EB796_015004 [Bugula neritina]
MFTKEDIDTLPAIPPHQMTPPFTKDEISKAVKALKNKSAGEIYLNHHAKHPRGARKISWADTVKKDLKTYANITVDQCLNPAQDKIVSRSIVVKTVDVMS